MFRCSGAGSRSRQLLRIHGANQFIQHLRQMIDAVITRQRNRLNVRVILDGVVPCFNNPPAIFRNDTIQAFGENLPVLPVLCQMTPYDLSKGRLTYRFR